uniref:Myotubularin related protein 11 n=1 Tax=Erpetoichthys calabaricus TaxID=27687 RepID=A0A8C4RI45_ERPCA
VGAGVTSLVCVVSSLVQLMCDPHSRTLSGFQSLVQKEWAVAGHRFLNRFNYSGDNEKEEVRLSPVFLLFLDCVWQLLKQFPSYFEITEDYLVAVHDSTYIPIFNTFLANCQRERARRIQVRSCLKRMSSSMSYCDSILNNYTYPAAFFFNLVLYIVSIPAYITKLHSCQWLV